MADPDVIASRIHSVILAALHGSGTVNLIEKEYMEMEGVELRVDVWNCGAGSVDELLSLFPGLFVKEGEKWRAIVTRKVANIVNSMGASKRRKIRRVTRGTRSGRLRGEKLSSRDTIIDRNNSGVGNSADLASSDSHGKQHDLDKRTSRFDSGGYSDGYDGVDGNGTDCYESGYNGYNEATKDGKGASQADYEYSDSRSQPRYNCDDYISGNNSNPRFYDYEYDYGTGYSNDLQYSDGDANYYGYRKNERRAPSNGYSGFDRFDDGYGESRRSYRSYDGYDNRGGFNGRDEYSCDRYCHYDKYTSKTQGSYRDDDFYWKDERYGADYGDRWNNDRPIDSNGTDFSTRGDVKRARREAPIVDKRRMNRIDGYDTAKVDVDSKVAHAGSQAHMKKRRSVNAGNGDENGNMDVAPRDPHAENMVHVKKGRYGSAGNADVNGNNKNGFAKLRDSHETNDGLRANRKRKIPEAESGIDEPRPKMIMGRNSDLVNQSKNDKFIQEKISKAMKEVESVLNNGDMPDNVKIRMINLISINQSLELELLEVKKAKRIESESR